MNSVNCYYIVVCWLIDKGLATNLAQMLTTSSSSYLHENDPLHRQHSPGIITISSLLIDYAPILPIPILSRCAGLYS